MTLNDLNDFWQRNRKKIIAAVLILTIGIGALFFWQSFQRNGEPGPTNGGEKIPAFAFAGDTWKISGEVNLSKLAETNLP